MNNLIRGEFYKLRKNNLSSKLALIILFTIYASVYTVILEYIRPGNMNIIEGRNFYNAVILSFAIIRYIIFAFAIIASIFIVTDLKELTLKKSFTYGYKRIEVIFSKIIVFLIISLIVLLTYVISTAVYTGIIDGFGIINFRYLLKIFYTGVLYNMAAIIITAVIGILTESYLCTMVSALIICMSWDWIGKFNSFLPWIMGQEALKSYEYSGICSGNIGKALMSIVITLGLSLYTIYAFVKRKNY